MPAPTRPLPRDLAADIDTEITADRWRQYVWLIEDIFFDARMTRTVLDPRDAYALAAELRAAAFAYGMAVEAAITAKAHR